MLRYLTIGKRVIPTVALLILAAWTVTRAEAGASASAPTKNTRASQLAAHRASHNTAKNDFGITEYSSSSPSSAYQRSR